MTNPDDTINWAGVEAMDDWLDDEVNVTYRVQPLAQDWARVAKAAEEIGEAIAELILLTGQNPRKPLDPTAYSRLMAELADGAFTGIYAIQHFTKDIADTRAILAAAQHKHLTRLGFHTGRTRAMERSLPRDSGQSPSHPRGSHLLLPRMRTADQMGYSTWMLDSLRRYPANRRGDRWDYSASQ